MNKDGYQSTSARRALALLNSPLYTESTTQINGTALPFLYEIIQDLPYSNKINAPSESATKCHLNENLNRK